MNRALPEYKSEAYVYLCVCVCVCMYVCVCNVCMYVHKDCKSILSVLACDSTTILLTSTHVNPHTVNIMAVHTSTLTTWAGMQL